MPSQSHANTRCPWADISDSMQKYHDTEWGVPVHDDRRHFEFLVLEGAQAGLSWSTVLNKREAFRKAFAGFDPTRVARFGEKQIVKLLQDAAIIRNRAKIEAAVNNARHFLKVQQEFGTFDNYIWRFVGGQPIQNRPKTLKNLPVTTKESDALSHDLKQRGFKFVGSTIIYSHLQACGLVNDHLVSCFRHAECARLAL